MTRTFRAVVVLCIFFAVVLSAQTVILSPIGTTRQLQQVQFVQLTKGVLAEPDAAKGQAAFDACMVTANSAPVCEPIRASAINGDIQDRFYAVMRALYGTNLSGSQKDQLFTTNKIWLQQGL